MADSSLIVTISQTDQLLPDSRTDKALLVKVRDHLSGIIGGSKRASSVKVFADGTAFASASGTVTVAGADAGTYTTTINGVGIDATGTAGDDTATASDIAAAINASTDALVQYLVTASSAAGVVTITASHPGITGNCITLAATGTAATASGARLTGGTGGNVTPTTVTV